MNDTSGLMSGTPLAQYDRQQRCWKTSEATSLWALTLSSLTLPTWGGLHAGVLYELPTPERPTAEIDCSLLPTPRAQLGEQRNQTIWLRPLDEPQNLENALARIPGAPMRKRLRDGSASQADLHQQPGLAIA